MTTLPTPASHDEIAHRAREIWLSRGCPEGDDLTIWLLAERELSAPALTKPTLAQPKTSRNHRPAGANKSPSTKDTIDAGKLEERLDRFGEPPQRSPTAVDLS